MEADPGATGASIVIRLLFDNVMDVLLPERLGGLLPEEVVIDAVHVRDLPGGAGLTDRELLEIATGEGRIVVTKNIRDFQPLSNEWNTQARTHPGMIFISTKSFPEKGRNAEIGAILAALAAMIGRNEVPAPGTTTFLR